MAQWGLKAQKSTRLLQLPILKVWWLTQIHISSIWSVYEVCICADVCTWLLGLKMLYLTTAHPSSTIYIYESDVYLDFVVAVIMTNRFTFSSCSRYDTCNRGGWLRSYRVWKSKWGVGGGWMGLKIRLSLRRPIISHRRSQCSPTRMTPVWNVHDGMTVHDEEGAARLLLFQEMLLRLAWEGSDRSPRWLFRLEDLLILFLWWK